MKPKTKNKITTPGYFIKRLRDNNFVVLRIFQDYNQSDPRRWTLLIDPQQASVFVTCYENKDNAGDLLFEFHDGGRLFPKNWSISTDSIEVIVTHLISRGVSQSDETNSYYKERV